MVHRACDRCYQVKASCVYLRADSCTRCTRLSYDCQTRRPLRKSGRPRLTSSSPQHDGEISVGLTLHSSYGCLRSSKLFLYNPSILPPNYQQHELLLINYLLQPEQIASLLYGSTFNHGLLQSIAAQFYSADEKLKHGLLALATSISKAKKIESIEPVAHGHEHSSRALTLYNKFSIDTLDDAKANLALALSLVTYSDLSLGLPTLPIARSALLRIQPWKTQLIGQTTEDTDPCIICILFVEMFECLLTGQLPVFRYEVTAGTQLIDRYYGICHELLPNFYDICLLYSSWGQLKPLFTAEQILADLDSWQPEFTMNTRRSLVASDEYLHYLRQAKCFKLTAQLLVLQSQKSVFALMLKQSLASELQQEVRLAIAEGKGRPKYLLFPYFISCIELGDTTPEADKNTRAIMEEISNGMASRACETMSQCLQSIWRGRQQYPDLLWNRCISEGQIIAMGP